MEERINYTKLQSLETVDGLVKEIFCKKEVDDYKFILFVDTLTVLNHLKNKIQKKSERLPKLFSELIPLKHLLGTLRDDKNYIISDEKTTNRYITITYLGDENGPLDAIIKTPKKELKIDVTTALDKDRERVFPREDIRAFDVQELGKEMAEDILKRINEKSHKRDEDVFLLIPVMHKVKLADPNGEIAIAAEIVKKQLKVLNIKNKIALVINSDLAGSMPRILLL